MADEPKLQEVAELPDPRKDDMLSALRETIAAVKAGGIRSVAIITVDNDNNFVSQRQGRLNYLEDAGVLVTALFGMLNEQPHVYQPAGNITDDSEDEAPPDGERTD